MAVLCIGDFTLAANEEMSGDISSIKGGSSDAIDPIMLQLQYLFPMLQIVSVTTTLEPVLVHSMPKTKAQYTRGWCQIIHTYSSAPQCRKPQIQVSLLLLLFATYDVGAEGMT